MGAPNSNDAALSTRGGASALAGTAQGLDFAEVVSRYETQLLGYVAHFVGPEDAQDLVQETFLRLHRHCRSGGEVSSSWLFRVAHNIAVDHSRRRRTRERAREGAARDMRPNGASAGGEHGGSAGAAGLGPMVRRAAGERALEEMKQLPEKQRQVVLLKVVQEMSFREIAQATGMTVGNVGYHLNQGLAELARRLKAAGVM